MKQDKVFTLKVKAAKKRLAREASVNQISGSQTLAFGSSVSLGEVQGTDWLNRGKVLGECDLTGKKCSISELGVRDKVTPPLPLFLRIPYQSQVIYRSAIISILKELDAVISVSDLVERYGFAGGAS